MRSPRSLMTRFDDLQQCHFACHASSPHYIRQGGKRKRCLSRVLHTRTESEVVKTSLAGQREGKGREAGKSRGTRKQELPHLDSRIPAEVMQDMSRSKVMTH